MGPDFDTIDILKRRWDALQPLDPKNEARLWKKLRLEWNYNSNHLEGNTLTYDETEFLLIHGGAHGDHQLRDYEEMKAHDLGINHVRTLAGEQRVIGEADIRDLNKIILKEPFWKEAITSGGEATRKQVIPGEYKAAPNNVRTATGEIFEFASPAETPAKMHELVLWLGGELGTRTRHPLELVAKLHHDFVLIHPFDDGNGRVARLLMNYVLLRLGYPPIIIKSKDKTGYLTALRKADTSDLPAFTRYLAVQAEWSLGLGIRAARGESIEETSDVEKEITIFIRDQQAPRDRVKRRSLEVLRELADTSWGTLFSQFEQKASKLYPLFAEHTVCLSDPRSPVGNWQEFFEDFIAKGIGSRFQVIVCLRGYQGEVRPPFDVQAECRLDLTDFEYSVTCLGDQVSQKLYSEPILSDEIETITSKVLKRLFEEIKGRARPE